MGIFDDPDPFALAPKAPAAKPTLAKVRYTHDAIIDRIVSCPAISQNELSKEFGFSVAWMSIVINSDAFQERLAERKAELIDPIIKATAEEKAYAAASRALDRIIDRLDSPIHGAIKTQDLVSIAKLGVAPKQAPAPAPSNHLYVVQLPPPAANSQEWLAGRSDPRGPLQMVEIAPRG
jgi:hypothetical protein